MRKQGNIEIWGENFTLKAEGGTVVATDINGEKAGVLYPDAEMNFIGHVTVKSYFGAAPVALKKDGEIVVNNNMAMV